MAAINFPESPQDNATFTANGIAYTYNAAKTQWAADNLSIFDSRESPEFTGIPVAPTAAAGTNTTQLATTAFVATAAAAAAGDTLPAQTGNTGKYLTTDGSTTSWAAVSAGAGYEIGDGLELNSVTTIDWSTLPSPLTEINGIASEQYFGGIGLSASDTHIVIGTPGGAGAVTAFDVYSAETGAFLRSIEKIDPAALGDGGFGAFVSISGTKVIMGHPLAASVAGAAYIFEATTGALLHTLSAPTGGAVTTGQAVAISPNYAAVLSLTSAQTSSRIGVYNVSTGALLHTIAQVTNGNGHGSLSITDQYLVAGEPLRDRDGQPTSDNSGAVSVYNTVTGSLLHTIVEPTPSVSGDFGFSVSVHGDYIAIGGAPDTYGAVYVYSASTGSLLHTFQNPLPAETGTTYTYGFGKSVSVYGGYLLVGALDAPEPGTIGSSWGRAYLYDLTNGSLIQTIYGTSNNDNLGDSVAMGPGIIAIGVPQYDSNGLSNNGKAVIYKTDVTTADYLQPDSTIATTSYVDTAVSNLVDSSPAALNTLNELAAALGDDANFSTTVTNSIASKADDAATTSALASKAPLASPTFTGVPVAPTATAGTNTTQIATTAFVTAATVAASGDTLPAQTDNAGKYLTTDGSTTSWAEIVSTGGSKEFIANGPIAAGAPVVLDPAGTVSPVATIAANGTEMAAGHQALFPAIGMTSMAIMLTHNTNYSTYKRAATCPITGRSVFFGEMSTLLNMNSNYRTRRVIQGSAPNASATEMILGPLVELSDAVAGANMHNVCFSGNGDGVFIITYQTATAYNNTASAGLAARLGKVDSSGNITMFNTETVKVGRPSNYTSQYSDSSSVSNQWLNSIVWDPIASKFVIVYTGYSWLTDGVKAQTTIGTALYSYDNSNTLSPAGGQGLTSLGYYGSSNIKLKALWDSTRERVTTIFFGQDRRYLSNFTSDNYFHESIFDVIDGEIQPLVPITAPIPYVSTTTAVWAFQTDMEYNPTQGTFLLLPESSTSNESIFYSFAFDGSAVSSLVAVSRPSTLLKGIDNTGISYYRDIIYEASSDSITIAYSAPNMTYGGTHANKNSIYTATLDASDYTSVLSNIEAYDASWRGNTTLWNGSNSYARVGVAAAQYVELNWSPILNKFLMYRQTNELDSYQVNYSYTQSNSDRYRDAYDLVQVISVSNYPQAIGFSEGTVSDGTPVPVTLAGGVNTNQSGLSIERNYYFQTDGSLGINRTDYLVGLALSDTELQVADLSDLDNVNLSLYATTSALASKAPLESPTFTGVPVAPTATAGTNTTQLATTAFVAAATAAAAGDTLPAQTGNTGKYLTTDGSSTSWAEVASGGGLSFIQDFTASGSITANTPVVLNSTGTVSTLGVVGQGSTAVNYGLQYAIGSAYSDGNLVYDSQNDQFIMYKWGGLKIGKMVGSSITWGSFIDLGLNDYLTVKANSVYDATLDRHIVLGPTQSNSDTPTTFWQAQVGDGTYSYISESYSQTSQLQSESASTWNSTQVGPVSVGPGKVLFLYRAAGTFDPTINIATGTVDSPFTFGTPVTLTSKDMNVTSSSSIAIAYSETAGVAYAAYINTSFQLEYAIIDVSGASPVVLSTHIIVQPINGDWQPYSANLVIKDNYVILGYYHYNQPFKTVGGYIDSGTKQITFGTSATSSLNAGSTGTIRIVYTKYNNFAVLQQDSSTVYNISNYTVSEQGALTSISSENVTLESAPTFQNGMLFMAFSTVDNNLLINYSTSSGTSYGYSGWRDYGFVHKAQTLGPVVSNADRFLGFATTSVADAATVPVTLVGVQGGLSGLTPATDYYVTGTGSLASGDTGYRKVGTALSSSSILMDDSSNVIGYATTSYVNTAITNLVDSSPAALNTLNELAAALGDDANFSTTVTNSIASKADDAATTSALATKAPLASPTFTGVPVAPTATAGTNTTQLATTAFVTAATAAAAGDTLPAQTGNTGKYLTTDGSTTSWATVASGSSYTIGTNLQAVDTITSVTWPASPELVTRIDGSGTELVGGDKIFLSANYLVAKRNNQNDGSASGSNNTVFQVYSKNGAALLRTITVPMYTEAYLDPTDAASVYQDYLVVADKRSNNSTGGNLYVYNLATGALVTTLTPEANTRFMSAALGENKIAVVLYQSSNTVGSIRVYNLTTGELISSGAAPAGVNAGTVGFGRTLAMSGDYITVGAPESGRAYIYNSNTCALLHTLGTGLTPGVIKPQFSNRLDMDGDNIIVGTVGLGNPAAAHAYIISASTGSLLRTIVYSDANSAYPSSDDNFGRQCLKISGDYALIGVQSEDSAGDTAGMAVLYNITDGSVVYSIYGEDAADVFGDQGDISGGTIAISARNISGSNEPGYIKVYQGVEVSETILSTTSAVATTSYVDTAITNLVDSSPAALNTLNELAAALGDDANFSTTVTNSIASKAPLASPTFTGVPVAPTATAGTNTTQLATTAFVTAATVAAAGDTLPAQTGNTGKYLTTDGSTTSWATVASGAGYEIGDGLELNSVSTTSWPVSPNLVTTINGTVNGEASGRAVASTSQYTVVGRNDYSKVTIHNTSTGALLHTINNPDSVGGFGVYLDISGDNIAIAHGYANKVFIYSASTGSLVRTFTNPGSFNNFGVNAKIEGNIVAITSFGPTAGNYDGYLHVYNISTGSLLWQKANPNTDGGTTDDAFRYGLAITANYIAQGATDADTGGSNSGIVYIFDKNTGDVVRTISAPSPAVNLRFGSYLDMDGTNLVVATGSTSHGLVYLFDILTGNLLASVSNPGAGDGSAADSFAYVALDGDYLAVGANANAVGGSNSGSAYLFNISNLNSIATVYSLHGTSAGAYFGTSLSLSQGFLSIGEYSAAAGGTSRGSVRIYAADVTTADYLQPDSTIATTSYVDTAITNLVDSSPAALNTLNELAAALGDDANFSTTVTNTLATKAPLASPTFTGVPVAPTATAGTNTTQLATTAFVTAATANAGGSSDELEFTANGAVTAGKLVVLDAAGTVSQVAASEAGLPQIPYTDLAAGTAGQHVLLWDDYNEELLYIANVANRYNIDITTQSVSKLSQSSWSFNTGSKPQALMIPNTGYFIARGVSPQDMAALILGKNIGGAVSIAAYADISSVLQWRYKLSDIHIFPNGEAYLFGSEYISFSEGQPLLSAWKINYDTVANTISLGARQDSTINISAVDNYTFFLNIITDKNNNTFSIYYRGGALYVSPISEAGGAISWGAEKTISVTSSPQYEPWPNRPTSHEKVKYSAHTDRFYLPFKYAATHVGCWVFSLSADGTGILKNTILLSGMPGANEYEAVTIGVSQTTENVGFIINTRTGSPGQNWGNHFGLINADGVYTSSEVYTGTGGNSAGNSYDNPYLSSVDIGGAVVFGMKRFDSITQYSLTLHVARMTTTTNAQNWIGIASDTVSDGSAVNVHLSTGLSNEHTGLSVGSKYYAAADGGLTTTPSLGYGLVGEALSSTTLQIVSESDLSGYATLLNATLVGTPTAPTATAGNASTQIATTAFVADATTSALATKAPLASPTFTGVTTLTATSEVLQPKFSAGFGAVDHDIANGSIFYHDNMMGNFDAAFINVPTTVDLVTSAVLVMADGQVWGPSSYVRVNGTEYVVKWLGGTAPTMSADVVDVVSYSLINRNGTWVVIGSHSAYSAAV